MDLPPDIDLVDGPTLNQAYDQGSLSRGIVYADGGRVHLLGSGPGLLKATCAGSGRATYVLTVRWYGERGRVQIDDTCTCPLGGSCKHCVAALVTAKRHALAIGRSTPGGAEAKSTTRSEWRHVLADLGTAETIARQPLPLALEFDVDTPRATHWEPHPDPRIALRPMRLGKSGRWIKTGATWSDIASPYGYDLRDADPRQISVLRSLMASGRIGEHSGVERAPLAQFDADVWHHLARAVEVGIALIGTRRHDVVELAVSPARPVVDLAADDGGDVTLDAHLLLDGETIVLGDGYSGLVGNPPHGIWQLDGPVLRLVPLHDEMHPTLARLVASDPLVVPASDVDELLDVYQPSLAQHATVASSDGTVKITESVFDAIVLNVDRVTSGRALLHWGARYRRGPRTNEHPLNSTAGRFRDRARERDAVRDLSEPGRMPERWRSVLVGPDGLLRDGSVEGAGLVDLVTELVPWLESEEDVVVVMGGELPELREAVEDPLISLTVTDADDPRGRNDWFDLDVTVSVDGEVVDFVSLFAALNAGDEVLILPTGTWLRLDVPELDRLRTLIEEARGLAEPTSSGTVRLNRFQTSWWDELTGLGVVAQQSQRWAESVGRMSALAAPEPVPTPAGLKAELRHYQQEGFEWLAFLHANRLGGILADDMGLGKTLQTLALCLHVAEVNPDSRFLVVAPTSVVENWARESARFAPGLAVATIRETARRRGCPLAEAIADATLVVTSYALFRLEFDEYAEHDWELLLLDEAQFVKNHTGKTYQCVRRLDASTKIAITGTPLENTLMDLWALLSITAPGLYPDPKRFSETYRRPIEKGTHPEMLATLRRRIAPLVRRRTKDAVLTELPPKTEQTVDVELSPRHARIYQAQLQRQRQKVLGLVGDVQKNRFEILRSLTILRQLALDPALVDEEHEGVGSAKLDRLMDDLTQVVAEGHRALVFSQFTRYLARLRTRLDEAGVDHAYLDGRTRRREEEISRFKDGDAPVFVISLKAGGFGLNLTEADYVFILDPWWNPATEVQAVDRTHRIGQENPVMVYRYVANGTIEEKVMELKARKADLFANVIDAEGALSGALTDDDIRGLLDLG